MWAFIWKSNEIIAILISIKCFESVHSVNNYNEHATIYPKSEWNKEYNGQ